MNQSFLPDFVFPLKIIPKLYIIVLNLENEINEEDPGILVAQFKLLLVLNSLE